MKRIFSFLLVIFFLMPCFCFAQEQDDEITLLEASSAEDVAAALMDLEGDPEARLVVFGDKLPEDTGAKEIIYYEEYNEYILQFESTEEAAQVQEDLSDDYSVWQDAVVEMYDSASRNWDTYSYGTTVMGVDFYLDGVSSAVDEVVVGVVDSGVDPSNPFFSKGVILPDSCDLVDPDRSLTDADGHGTHVCGIIADMTPDQVKILAVRIFEDKVTNLSLVLTGVQYCYEHGADVINLSLGAKVAGDPLADMFAQTKEAGVVVVCASGNESTAVSYPASSPNTVAVSAMDEKCAYCTYSNRGEEIDFCAPGSWVDSAAPSTGKKIRTTEKSGTSMAAPHISAIYAYMKLAYPSATYDELYDLVKQYCVDINEPGWDEKTGWGYPDIDGLFELHLNIKDCNTPHFSAKYNFYFGEPVKQTTSVRYKQIVLREGIDYKVSYKNNNKIGTATVTYTGLGKFSGTLKKTFRIIPRIVDFKEVSQHGKGAVYVKYKSIKGSPKYQIAYRIKGGKTWTKVNTTKTSKVIKGLKSKKKYYFKVRAYKKVDGKNYIGDWSDTWSVVVK